MTSPCYKTAPETEDRTGAGETFLQHGADWLTFTSGSTVGGKVHARFDLREMIKLASHKMKIASIGPENNQEHSRPRA